MKQKPEKPYKAGRFLVAKRYKTGGCFVQLKFGRRVLLELHIKVNEDESFRDTEAFLNLQKNADEYHQAGWVVPPPVGRNQKRLAEFQDLPALANFFASGQQYPKPQRHPESSLF